MNNTFMAVVVLTMLLLGCTAVPNTPGQFEWQQISPKGLYLDVAPLDLDILVVEERNFHFGGTRLIAQRAAHSPRGLLVVSYAEKGKIPRPMSAQYTDERGIPGLFAEAISESIGASAASSVSLRYEETILVRGDRHGALYSWHGQVDGMPVKNCWLLAGALVAFPTRRDFVRMDVQYDTVLGMFDCTRSQEELATFFREARVFGHFRKTD